MWVWVLWDSVMDQELLIICLQIHFTYRTVSRTLAYHILWHHNFLKARIVHFHALIESLVLLRPKKWINNVITLYCEAIGCGGARMKLLQYVYFWPISSVLLSRSLSLSPYPYQGSQRLVPRRHGQPDRHIQRIQLLQQQVQGVPKLLLYWKPNVIWTNKFATPHVYSRYKTNKNVTLSHHQNKCIS